jgi:hypothetical protein
MFMIMTCSLHDRDHARDLGHVPCAMFMTNLVAKVKLMIMKNKLMAMANNRSQKFMTITKLMIMDKFITVSMVTW